MAIARRCGKIYRRRTLTYTYTTCIDAHERVCNRADTIGAMADLVRGRESRYLRSIPSVKWRNPSLEPQPSIQITALQSEYSLFTRDTESAVLPVCRELGTVLVAFSPLGRGLLTGKVKSRAELAEEDYRLKIPLFA